MKLIVYSLIFLLQILTKLEANIQDLTVTVQKLRNLYEATCVITGNSTNLAVDWITDISSKSVAIDTNFIPRRDSVYNCDITNGNDRCNEYWYNKQSWNVTESLNNKLGPVLDRRWERFTNTYTSGDSFSHITTLKEEFEIHISIRGSEGHLYLCDYYNPAASNCYWFIINGWSGRTTGIRKCISWTIPRTISNSPSGSCYTLLQNNSLYPALLDPSRWVHFSLIRTGNKIILHKLGEDNLIIDYVDSGNLYSAQNLVVRSRGSAYWKLHNYQYMFTNLESTTYIGPGFQLKSNTFCGSLFVNMCMNCKLIFEVLHTQQGFEITQNTTEVYSSTKNQWKEVKIIVPNINVDVINLRVATVCQDCENPFWAIDDFQICEEQEIRLRRSTLKLNEIACQLVSTSEQITYDGTISNQVSEVLCPDETFGNTCENCSILSRTNCNQQIICNVDWTGEHVCRCSSGFTGKDCLQQCPKYYYGSGCREQCGYCEFTECHHITGNCQASQCLYEYKGSKCKTPPLPILKVAPKVLTINHVSCVIQVQDSSYIGSPAPSYYKIQYKLQANNKWTNLSQFNLEYREPIEITGLDILSTYNIRAVLVMDDEKSFEMESVPKATITTTCAFVEEKNINLKVTNTTATITFQSNSENCRSNDYRIWLDDKIVAKSDSYQFDIMNLIPFTKYKVVVRNIVSNGSLILNLQTEEGVSSNVLNITASSDPTSITVSWNLPQTPHGNIKYYQVSYQHFYNLGCVRPNATNAEFHQHLNVYDTTTTLKDLVPYSEYIIEIVPVTVMLGESSTLRAVTAASAIPDENEMPSIDNIAAASTFINILLNAPNCTAVRGPYLVQVLFQCYTNWCSQSLDSYNITMFDKKHILRIQPLFPYTTYDINIKIRRIPELTDGPNVLTKISTLASVPNVIQNIVVYSKNKTSVSIRFPLPYPPTGILVEYKITYCYKKSWSLYNTCDEIYSPTKECLLWRYLQCVTVPNLISDTTYSFSIAGKNNNTEFGGSSEFTAVTQTGSPTAIQNLTAQWDDYYNLTLTWVHPSLSNGVITNFDFQILKFLTMCKDSTLPMSEEKYQYSYSLTIEINKSCYSSILDIFGWASTVYKGNIASLHNIISPPPTPSFDVEPKIVTITNTSMFLDLQGLRDFESEGLMYILLSTPTDAGVKGEYVDNIWTKSELSKTFTSWIAAEYNYNFLNLTPKVIVLGSDLKFQSSYLQREIYNRALSPATYYEITILLINTYMSIERYAVYKISVTTNGLMPERFIDESNNSLFALLLLLIVPAIIWFIVWKIRKQKGISWNTLITMTNSENPAVSSPDIIPLTTNDSRKTNSTISTKRKASNSNNEQSTTNQYSKPIKIIEFENYVKESVLNGELERQHQLFPRGQTKPWEYGSLPQNKSKNRYKNLIAYDHTRVKLEKINGEEFSDYINANYIEGYKSPKAYIATQGPKPTTINDFWRMIWQENVLYIVMLANVIEGGKKKSEQYWPNINERIAYSNIQVLHINTQVFADYEYRTFSVQCENETRKIEHLHFTSWPDHGVPLYCQSLIPFLRKLLTIPQGSSPIVVHCSAGVGRTGTIILSDLCLRMAAREGIVDVLKLQHRIREQRVNLVDNLEQYKLVHLVLLECLIAPQTSFTCDETIEKCITKILETDTLQHHIEYLDNTDWQDYAMQPLTSLELKPQWALKNRFLDIVPTGIGRIYLSRYPVSDEHSDYINAVEVDGFRAPQRFIATQQPLPHTVCDFWRMIDEKDVSIIISLNGISKEDKTSCVFWPNENNEEMKPVPFLTISFQNKTKNEIYNIITITVQNTKTKKVTKRIIHLICFKNWLPSQVVPENNETLITIWEEMEKLTRGNHTPIVVTCYDGVTACGLFLALTFVIEKIQLEQQCDVCLAVRTVRHNQKKFVTKKEQFIFLYKATLIYLSGFELYSNFNSIIKN